MVSNLDTKHLSVKRFTSMEEYNSFKDEIVEEIVEIENFNEKDGKVENFILAPNYITYIRKTAREENIISELSKNKRKKLKKGIKEIEDKGIEFFYETPVSKETFEEWFNLYKKNLSEKDLGIVIAKDNWFETSLDKCQKIGVFFKKDNKLIAGILGRSYDEKNDLPKRFSISFSSIETEYKKLGVNEYLNLKIIEIANKEDYEYISRGKDTNFYGKHLSCGIPIFKTSLGYKAIPLKSNPEMLIKINNLDNFKDKVIIYSYKDNVISNKLIGNVILKDKSDTSYNEYKFNFLEELKVYYYENKKLQLIETIALK